MDGIENKIQGEVKEPYLKPNESSFGVKENINSILINSILEKGKNELKVNGVENNSLAQSEFEEFKQKIEKEQEILKNKNDISKELNQELGKNDLLELKKKITAIKKINLLNGGKEFIDFVKNGVSEREQENLYYLIRSIDNIENVISYLFKNNSLPNNKEGFDKLLSSKKTINNDFKELLKVDLNGLDLIKINEVKQNIEKIKPLLNSNQIIEIEEKNKEIEKLNTKEKDEKIEEKDEKIEEKDEKIEEKDEKIEEKDKKIEEKDKKIEEKDKKIEEIIKNTKKFEGYSSLKGINWDVIENENSSSYDLNIQVEKLREIFKNPVNYKNFVEENIEKKGGDTIEGKRKAYNEAVRFAGSLGVNLPEIPDFDHMVGEKNSFPKNMDDFAKKQILDSLGAKNVDELTINGDKFSLGDKQIVIGEDGELEFYNVSEGGYKLESDIAELGDNYKEVDKFKTKINFIRDKYKQTGDELNEMYLQKQKLEEKKKSGFNNGYEKNESDNDLREIDQKINEKKIYLESLISLAKDTTKDYKKFLKENVYKVNENKEEKQKETLKFLHSIGLDEIQQSEIDKIIALLNNTTLGKKLGFKTKINLSNGELGFNDGFDGISVPEKKKFAEVMNIIITGDKTIPIDINSISSIGGGVIFKGDNGKDVLINKGGYIRNKLGINPYWKIYNNVINYKSNK